MAVPIGTVRKILGSVAPMSGRPNRCLGRSVLVDEQPATELLVLPYELDGTCLAGHDHRVQAVEGAPSALEERTVERRHTQRVRRLMDGDEIEERVDIVDLALGRNDQLTAVTQRPEQPSDRRVEAGARQQQEPVDLSVVPLEAGGHGHREVSVQNRYTFGSTGGTGREDHVRLVGRSGLMRSADRQHRLIDNITRDRRDLAKSVVTIAGRDRRSGTRRRNQRSDSRSRLRYVDRHIRRPELPDRKNGHREFDRAGQNDGDPITSFDPDGPQSSRQRAGPRVEFFVAERHSARSHRRCGRRSLDRLRYSHRHEYVVDRWREIP